MYLGKVLGNILIEASICAIVIIKVHRTWKVCHDMTLE